VAHTKTSYCKRITYGKNLNYQHCQQRTKEHLQVKPGEKNTNGKHAVPQVYNQMQYRQKNQERHAGKLHLPNNFKLTWVEALL
jgi:hypothetical protein